jgi:hypothetical protein
LIPGVSKDKNFMDRNKQMSTIEPVNTSGMQTANTSTLVKSPDHN